MARSRLVFTVGVLASLGAGACGNLIGLDKFVDCTEFPNLCTDGGAGDADAPDVVQPDVVQPDVVQPDVVQPDVVQPDTGPPLPDGSVGSDWAKYRVPMYDGGRADAAGMIDPTDVDPGTVSGLLDAGAAADGAALATLTLMPTNETVSRWIRGSDQVIVPTFEAARQHCLTVGGRVPTRIELLMLLDSTERSPDGAAPFMLRREVRPTGGLPANYAKGYWTSTVVRTDAAIDFWVVNFESGAVTRQPSGVSAFWGVLCVL